MRLGLTVIGKRCPRCGHAPLFLPADQPEVEKGDEVPDDYPVCVH